MFLPSLTAISGYFARLFALLVLVWWILSHSPAKAQQENATITPFQPVSGMLDTRNLREEWQFDGTTGQLISIVAERVEGDLDLVIELRNSADQLLAANDNATRDTTDARIEALILPNDDTYTITVYREGLRNGSTSGRFQLQLLDGYSLYDTTQLGATFAGPDPQTVAMIVGERFYMTAQATLPAATPYLLSWRFMDTTGVQWIFSHNTNDEWTLSVETARNEVLRTASGTSAALPDGGAAGNFTFHRTETDFQVLVNNQPIATAEVVPQLIPASIGQFSVVTTIPSDDNTMTMLNSIRLTTAFYDSDPFLVAIPPTPSGQRLYNFDASPAQVVSTLRALDYLPLPTQTSGLQGDITSSFITNDEASFNAFPLIERPFRNFVLSWKASFLSGTPSAACGVIFRQTSGDSYATVLHTPAGGLYIFQVAAGEVQPFGISTITPLLEQGLQTSNTFTLLTADDTASLFINGRWAADVTLTDTSGLTLTQLALDNNIPTYCQLDRVWLWSLD